jgi:hypothetical protein
VPSLADYVAREEERERVRVAGRVRRRGLDADDPLNGPDYGAAYDRAVAERARDEWIAFTAAQRERARRERAEHTKLIRAMY